MSKFIEVLNKNNSKEFINVFYIIRMFEEEDVGTTSNNRGKYVSFTRVSIHVRDTQFLYHVNMEMGSFLKMIINTPDL